MSKKMSVTMTQGELENIVQKSFQAGAGFAMKALGEMKIPDDFGVTQVGAMIVRSKQLEIAPVAPVEAKAPVKPAKVAKVKKKAPATKKPAKKRK
jgi:hypothetical protein